LVAVCFLLLTREQRNGILTILPIRRTTDGYIDSNTGI
jgi:hypothetical protein